ncbi:MAG: polyprenyl synthetase family protein [Opitutales bacterium]|nr:polyprenyl synthetase family protein [Opitutales bacterium]MCH8540241.1 polyprenyl synthetase family protein [Opitutales bacterium]
MIANDEIPEPHDNDGLALITKGMAPHLNALDGFLREQIAAFEPEVQELVEFCLQRSGKRIRPILLFLCGDSEKPDSSQIRAAAVLEMVHLATLVHDDILDEADLRHGLPTISHKYGAQTAVLLGDALFAHAVHLSAQFPDTTVCRLVSRATRTVCSGEIAQSARKDFELISKETYYRLIQMKTAELFRVACHLGAFLQGHSEETVKAVSEYGNHLGIGYQIYDDLADFFGQEAKVGKTLGTDWASGKITLPVLLYLQQHPAEERQRLLAEARKGGVKVLGDWREAMQEKGIFETVAQAVDEEITKGEKALGKHASALPALNLLPLGEFLRQKVHKLRPSFAVS